MALTRKERTLGCLWAMACGDALGVPSSFLTPEQIKSKYGWIDTFYPPEKGHIFHDGLLAGEYTDDTEQSMALMNAYIRDKKVVPMSVVKEIIAWADRVKDKYASPLGPSTERALKNIAAGGDITVSGKWGNTNGSSMRIAPLGIIHGLRGSTLQELARDVALTDLATHNTRVCNAAATAIAWGVAQAMRGEENLDKIVDATIEAAAEGGSTASQFPRRTSECALPSRATLCARPRTTSRRCTTCMPCSAAATCPRTPFRRRLRCSCWARAT